MQEATTSDEKVQQMQEDGNIISETEVERKYYDENSRSN